jgi:hypothetical protein
VDVKGTWYHGSPLVLEVLHPGSTITQNRALAEAFSHKPTVLSLDDDGRIRHNGIQPGYLYRIAEPLAPADIYPHPRSSMNPTLEWLIEREIRVELITFLGQEEKDLLTAQDIAELRENASQRSE